MKLTLTTRCETVQKTNGIPTVSGDHNGNDHKYRRFFHKRCGRCERFDTLDCSTRQWEAGLRELRMICRNAGLSEHVKWAHPCYMHAGRNIAIIGALRGDFRLNFFNAALMKTRKACWRNGGEYPVSRHDSFHGQRTGRGDGAHNRVLFEGSDGVRGSRHQAPKVEREIEVPDELVEAWMPIQSLPKHFTV